MRKHEEREKKDAQKFKNENPERHQGGPSASSKKVEKHTKDQSAGAEENTTKKQGNSI